MQDILKPYLFIALMKVPFQRLKLVFHSHSCSKSMSIYSNEYMT